MQPITKFQANQFVDHYVATRTKKPRPISTADALKAVRLFVPRDDVPDEDLVKMLVFYAIERRLVVDFDHSGKDAFARS
ncbi:hypothetical protein QBK99_15080 [Corticibacterium sp. UT-5YL-CI-8]|nr:hypothetical protein [Tianweitania sp. UT-5YL-CI-8]